MNTQILQTHKRICPRFQHTLQQRIILDAVAYFQ